MGIKICFKSISYCEILSGYKNPGPNTKKELSVYYQNVQGLIPFGYLGNEHPIFNDVKILELHHYVETHTPDIVILNETWLKESILHSEILPQDMYRIFRRDRCTCITISVFAPTSEE